MHIKAEGMTQCDIFHRFEKKRVEDKKKWEKGKRKDSSRSAEAAKVGLCGVGAPPEPSFAAEAGQISAVEGSPKPLLSF